VWSCGVVSPAESKVTCQLQKKRGMSPDLKSCGPGIINGSNMYSTVHTYCSDVIAGEGFGMTTVG